MRDRMAHRLHRVAEIWAEIVAFGISFEGSISSSFFFLTPSLADKEACLCFLAFLLRFFNLGKAGCNLVAAAKACRVWGFVSPPLKGQFWKSQKPNAEKENWFNVYLFSPERKNKMILFNTFWAVINLDFPTGSSFGERSLLGETWWSALIQPQNLWTTGFFC
ncbi:hypothetical protein E2320_006454 [Naja naja]|nr:hypothetical protein E2320_006454 [Naja naja]